MQLTTSRDGTSIAYEQMGRGTPVIFVMGAFNDRATGADLASRLARDFSVFCYDRRGRGDSGDRAPYAIEREVEDLDALIRVAGGTASVLGFSSGAWLALTAAEHGSSIDKLALFDTPPLARSAPHVAELSALIEQGRRGDAVEYFQRCVVGIPEQIVVQLRNAPFRPALERMAHTLVYDAKLVCETQPERKPVRSSVLALAGSQNPAFMFEMANAIAGAIPRARAQCVDGIGHDLVADVLGPVLEPFFRGAS